MLKIYNTMTKKVEEFKPIKENEVSMYVCGPTVYSYIHIGNARPVIFFDVLKNFLTFSGYKVNYVSNITDIDDKIINEAKKQKISEKELTNFYTDAFIKSSIKLGSNLPDIMPKATNYIDSMIKYINKLIDKDYAYKTDSGVYFRTSKVSNYGELSGQQINELNESVRIENKEDKQDFKDFTLWKITNEGIAFNSPFGIGRPGWHTECAVMNHDIFEGTIDIHGGGSDLIFPHHENENAQTIAHSNHELAKYWMHVGRIDFQSKKMSKSLGNTIWVKDLEDPISYRLLVLAHHYRGPINYNEELRLEFVDMYDKILRTTKRARIKFGLNYDSNEIDDLLINKFKEEMENDFNTPNVITLILEIIKEINKAIDIKIIIKLYNSLAIILDILGINVNINLTDKIVNDYNEWIEARNNKNYEKADLLRNELAKEGWI